MNTRVVTAKWIWGVLGMIFLLTLGEYVYIKCIQKEEEKEEVTKKMVVCVGEDTKIYGWDAMLYQTYRQNRDSYEGEEYTKNCMSIAVKPDWVGMGLSEFQKKALPEIAEKIKHSLGEGEVERTKEPLFCKVVDFRKNSIIIVYQVKESPAKESTQKQATFCYLLKAKEDRVEVYAGDLEHLLFITDLSKENVPAKIWEKLIKGMEMQDEAELYNFLESYSS